MCCRVGQRKVALRGLKQFASDSLPPESLLRHLILTELDEMETLTFLAKMDTWLRIAKRELW